MDIPYKYMTADLAKRCLPEVGDGTLRATQPQALNDPFECMILPATRGVAEAPSTEIATLMSSLNGSTPVTEQEVEKAKRERGHLFLRDLLVRQLSQRYGIVSFTCDPLNSLMWAHYSNYGSGFVIGYDKDIIRGLCDGTDCLREVRYGNNVIPLAILESLNEGNVNALLSSKSQSWEYEQEWRLIVELNRTIRTGMVDQLESPINLLRIPNEAVVEVYFTERTRPEEVDCVSNRLANSNNRYGTTSPTRLVATSGYGLATAGDTD